MGGLRVVIVPSCDPDPSVNVRVKLLKDQLESIRGDFHKSLKPKLMSHQYKALTQAELESMQEEVNHFLARNQLNISVYVTTIYHDIVVIGRTLVDEIVWEGIQ